MSLINQKQEAGTPACGKPGDPSERGLCPLSEEVGVTLPGHVRTGQVRSTCSARRRKGNSELPLGKKTCG